MPLPDKAAACRAALPAQWDESSAVIVQHFEVRGASPFAVAAALYGGPGFIARIHRRKRHTDLVETPWAGGGGAEGAAFTLPVGATRTRRFTSPSPAPAIAPAPVWNDELQTVLAGGGGGAHHPHHPRHHHHRADDNVYVVQSDVRTGVPYGDKIAVLSRTCVAPAVAAVAAAGSPPQAAVVRVSYCVRYGASLSRLVRGMVARGVDGGVRSMYDAVRAGLAGAVVEQLAAAGEVGGAAAAVTIRDLPPAAPLPPALRAVLASISGGTAAGAARPRTAAGTAAGTATATAGAEAVGSAERSSPLLLFENALLPSSSSAARALVALAGDPLLFARCAAGLLTLAVLAVVVRAMLWSRDACARDARCVDSALFSLLLSHPPENVAQALAGALLLLASNRIVAAFLGGVVGVVAAPGSKSGGEPGAVAAASEVAEDAAGGDNQQATTARPTKPRARLAASVGAAAAGEAAVAAADLAADLAVATASRLRSAAGKARTSVAAQLRPRASGGGTSAALLRETQQDLEREAAQRLRQRQPPPPRPPDEQATAVLVGGAPLALVEDYVQPATAPDPLAPADLLYVRPRRRRRQRPPSPAGDEGGGGGGGEIVPSPGGRSPPSRSPTPPSLASSSAAAAGQRRTVSPPTGPNIVKGKAWASASLVTRHTKPATALAPAPPRAGGPAARPPSPDLELFAVLPDGRAIPPGAAARLAARDAASDAGRDPLAGTNFGIDDEDGGSDDDDDDDDDGEDDGEPPLQELYENERRQAWGWGSSFPGSFLPSDRIGHWSDRDGRPGGNASARPVRVAAASPPPGWTWAPGSRWRLDVTGRDDGACVDANGWAYAVDFPALLALHGRSRRGWPPPPGSGRMTGGVFVRRRRWVRALLRAGPADDDGGVGAAGAPSHQEQLPPRALGGGARGDDDDEDEEDDGVASAGLSSSSPARAASSPPMGYYDSSEEETQEQLVPVERSDGDAEAEAAEITALPAAPAAAAEAPSPSPPPLMPPIDED